MSRPLPASWLVPDWPAPAQVRALSTTREGGVSRAPFDALNLGERAGDDPRAVADNRARVAERLGLPGEPCWLRQVHGTHVVDVATVEPEPHADAAVARVAGLVCAVLTADCLPVLLCDRAGTRVGIAHAGWRGLAAGVLEAVVDALEVPASELLAWLGPAIGPQAFEVGAQVRQRFVERDPASAQAFVPCGEGHWRGDLYQLARLRLASRGVSAVYGGGFCTYSDRARFYSYRRDGSTGRMASLIWLDGSRSTTDRGVSRPYERRDCSLRSQ